jgi:hypothetical protein
MYVADRAIWNAARVIVQRHGPYAEFTATRRLADAAQNGDAEGEGTWARILSAIRDLQRMKPRDGDWLH